MKTTSTPSIMYYSFTCHFFLSYSLIFYEGKLFSYKIVSTSTKHIYRIIFSQFFCRKIFIIINATLVSRYMGYLKSYTVSDSVLLATNAFCYRRIEKTVILLYTHSSLKSTRSEVNVLLVYQFSYYFFEKMNTKAYTKKSHLLVYNR